MYIMTSKRRCLLSSRPWNLAFTNYRLYATQRTPSMLTFPDKVLMHRLGLQLQSVAIIPAVRHPQQRVNVELGRLLVRQEHTRVVVELDQDDRTLYAEVERVFITEPADPAEIGLFEMFLDAFELHLSRICGQVEQVLLQYSKYKLLLVRCHRGHCDAFVRDDSVVSICSAKMSLVVVVPSSFWHSRVFHQLINLHL